MRGFMQGELEKDRGGHIARRKREYNPARKNGENDAANRKRPQEALQGRRPTVSDAGAVGKTPQDEGTARREGHSWHRENFSFFPATASARKPWPR
jgi:hypothetical protein